MKKLEGRLALITGASRGIGLAIAKAYAAEGARCVLAGRNAAALDKVAKELGAAGILPMDLDRPDSIRAATKSFAALHPKLDILVANAAVLGPRKPIAEDTLESWRATFQANVHANLLLLQGLDALLKKSDSGRVVIVSSGAARLPKPGGGSYAVTKAALEMMSLIYAQEVASTPIRVNIVNPGPTRTSMRAQVMPKEDPMTLKTPEDIAPLFVELGMASCAKSAEWFSADHWLKEQR
ncbi:MAG: SDR family NAD(P)-dependent oxidoreductase [Betaproteobacteria bacterium]